MIQLNDLNDVDAGPRTLICPKCGRPMEPVRFDHYTVERCTGCRGLFFEDALVREHLEAMDGSESLDIGPPRRENRDEVVRINCPACHAMMIRMVDVDQPHIWYESCPVCFGVYLDAGEFRDHKEHKVLNYFRDLFRRVERK